MSVYRRGNSWYINISLGGTRINRKAGNTKKEAQRAVEELRTKYRLEQLHLADIRKQKLPFHIVAMEYLDHVEDTKSMRTHELEDRDYTKHLHPFFSDKFIDEINNDLLLRYQAEKKAGGYANRTVNIHMGLVRKIRRFALTKKYISRDNLKYPMLDEPKKLHAFLTPEEYQIFKKNLSYPLALDRVVFGRLTGMRPAELTYLAWPDIDFDLKIAKIQGKPGLWKPKTNEERVVPLSKTALKILKRLYKKRKGPWVFSSSDKPVKSVRKALATAAKKSGFSKNVTPNMLRHTFATHALLEGADLKSLMEILGHKNISTTQKYLHSIQAHLRKTVELLDEEDENE